MSATAAAGSSAAATAASAAASSSTASSSSSSGSSSQPDFLTLILEVDPRRLFTDPSATELLLNDAGVAAGGVSASSKADVFTTYLLPAVLIFLNTHNALQHGNGLAIYLASPWSPTRLIYTSAPGRIVTHPASVDNEPDDSAGAAPDPNTYQHFGIVNRALWKAVRAAVKDAAAAHEQDDEHGDVSSDDDGMDDLPAAGFDSEAAQRRRRKRRRTTRWRRDRHVATAPLVSALAQALAHLSNIPPSSSSISSSAAQATSLPSGHSATILPRATTTMTSAKASGDLASVAGGGLSSWRPRILILSTLDGGLGRASADQASGRSRADGGAGAGVGSAMAYVPLMNCIFAAQKRGILIDVLKLSPGSDVVFLQQAAHLTGGNYLRLDLDEKGDAAAGGGSTLGPARRNGHESRSGGKTSNKTPLNLLQVLMTTFLPPRDLRYFPPTHTSTSSSSLSGAPSSSMGGTGILRLPTLDSVDFRAACFCHRTVVDVGYVCSVCLSIFCEPRSECLICASRFPRSTLRRYAEEHEIGAALAAYASAVSTGEAGEGGADGRA